MRLVSLLRGLGGCKVKVELIKQSTIFFTDKQILELYKPTGNILSRRTVIKAIAVSPLIAGSILTPHRDAEAFWPAVVGIIAAVATL